MSDTLVRMPRLADTLVEGTVGQWLKRVGDEVRRGEPLASIETDKVTTEISSPATGTLLEVLVGEGQTVPVETLIARIGSASEAPAVSEGRPSPAETTAPPSPAETTALPSPEQAAAPKPTPVAARLLADHGLEARQVSTRPGRLTKAEVMRHLASAAPPNLRHGALVPLTSMRRAIADHMTRAFQSIPHGRTVIAADLTQLVAWRDQHKAAFQAEHGANLTYSVLFVHALAAVLGRSQRGPVHLGVAVALDGGLIVPVIKGAESLGLGGTARALADLADRARANTLTPADTQGASMTVTNVGSFDNLTASPIIPLGQIGILAPGLVEQRPMVVDGALRLGWRCLLGLSFDRREVDDFGADRLLRAVVTQLEQAP